MDCSLTLPKRRSVIGARPYGEPAPDCDYLVAMQFTFASAVGLGGLSSHGPVDLVSVLTVSLTRRDLSSMNGTSGR